MPTHRPLIAYKADPQRGRRWAEVFAAEAPEFEFRTWSEVDDPTRVHYLAAWEPPPDLATALPNLRVLFSTGAGIDQFNLAALPPGLPLVRMVEPGIVRGMVEYVLHAVLDLHRDMPAYRRAQQGGLWAPLPVRPADERRVGVLGLGTLGQAVLQALLPLGFRCAGWSRSAHALPGVDCTAGTEALPGFLAGCDILVCLLPLTPQTRGFLDAERLAGLPPGAALVQVGRGPQLDVPALLAALASGRLAEAVLDVTDPEPLPPEHPLWHHPRVRITPHIASMTHPDSAARRLIDNLRRHRRGEPMVGLVDRARGY